MKIGSAVELVDQLVYKPGWMIKASDHSARFEGAIRVLFEYPTHNSNRDQAAGGYPESIMARAVFPLVVADFTDEDLYFAVLNLILRVEEHEAREFLRAGQTHWAPFHPHRADGMRRWAARKRAAALDRDLLFGIA